MAWMTFSCSLTVMLGSWSSLHRIAVTLSTIRAVDLVVWFGLAVSCVYASRRCRSLKGTQRDPHSRFPKGWRTGYLWFSAFSFGMGCWHLVSDLKAWLR